MLPSKRLFAAATIAVGSFAMIAPSYADDANPANRPPNDAHQAADQVRDAADRTVDSARTAADRAANNVHTGMTTAALPAGVESKDLNEADDIRSSLAGVTKQALNKNDFDNVVGYLVDADRTRVKEFKVEDSTKMDGRIDQIQKVWQQKYNQDFAMDGKTAFTDSFAMILQGEITDPQQVANSWPVAATSMNLGDRAQPAAARQEGDRAADADKTFGGKTNLEKGRNVAIVVISPSHGMGDVNASMIHELPDTWRFDIPDNISGQQLYDSLLNHLTYLGEHADQWPTDVNEAQRLFAHHVAQALYNIDPKAGMTGDHMDRTGTDRMNNTDRTNTDRMDPTNPANNQPARDANNRPDPLEQPNP